MLDLTRVSTADSERDRLDRRSPEEVPVALTTARRRNERKGGLDSRLKERRKRGGAGSPPAKEAKRSSSGAKDRDGSGRSGISPDIWTRRPVGGDALFTEVCLSSTIIDLFADISHTHMFGLRPRLVSVTEYESRAHRRGECVFILMNGGVLGE